MEWGKRNASRSTKSTRAELKSVRKAKYLYFTYDTWFSASHARRARDDGNGIVIEYTYAELHVNDRGDRATHVSNHADRAERVNYT